MMLASISHLRTRVSSSRLASYGRLDRPLCGRHASLHKTCKPPLPSLRFVQSSAAKSAYEDVPSIPTILSVSRSETPSVSPIGTRLSSFPVHGVFQSKSFLEILFAVVILELCKKSWVVALGESVLDLDKKLFPPSLSPILWVVKHTFYRFFCAGGTREEARLVINKLQSRKLSSILDFSVEDAPDSESCDRNTKEYMDCIEFAKECPDLRFSCIKTSALAPPGILEGISALLRYEQQHPGLAVMPWLKSCPPFMGTPSHAIPSSPVPPPLEASQIVEMEKFEARLHKIVQAAQKYNCPLLIDAEYQSQQPAIDYLTFRLMEQYNKGKTAVVYNTFQMYLRDSVERLQLAISEASSRGYVLGAKLVRGAYMHSERERAIRDGTPSPIHDTIEATHASYNTGVDMVIGNSSVAHLMVATHNGQSVRLATELMSKAGIVPGSSNVAFSQLYNMADYLSLTLAGMGHLATKYCPYGPVDKVMPYLMRRVHENKSVLGGQQYELSLLKAELYKRLGLRPTSSQV
eukprot:CAMPEP_0184656264 /NCGR_PEP_ID=MMETSP0308-20130426/16123_1 /TAXON_ID=38269 /ORGANISM="Gloeochaete witrockiana, Strain SAG 46.84" /LENGTH=519 /DNA_ID=CAMNT_0027093295 /DNA_START=30 /DNA_END=1589 /DNA_ORIENTATION=+